MRSSVMTIIFSACLLASWSNNSFASDTYTKIWETSGGLKTPESVLFDPKREWLYVSNINGSPTEKDGNGFIAKVSLQGKLIDAAWVSGLHAPKGMAIHGDKLYVSDIDTLVEIDLDTGAVSARHAAPGAVFLNDVTVDQSGRVYVSDMMTNTIHRLNAGYFEAWLIDDGLESPNGLHAEGERLIVGSWGVMTEGFNTDTPGALKQVALADRSITPLGDGRPMGNLDGVETDGQGGYYATDWMAGRVIRIAPDGAFDIVLELAQGSADHEFIVETGLLLIPMMSDGKLVAYQVKHSPNP